MLENFLVNVLHFAERQVWGTRQIGVFLKSLAEGGLSFDRMIATVMIIVNLFGFVLFGIPIKPYGEALDLEGYELVMVDEFEGDSLNTDLWYHRGVGARRSGFNAESQVQVRDGNLVITGSYLEDGEFGPGWYVGAIALAQKYNKGYFEIRCKCNKGAQFWSAFWIQGPNPYDHEKSAGGAGAGGAELDIFEAMNGGEKSKLMRDGVVQTIWCNGYDDDPDTLDAFRAGTFSGNNIYDEYNTYGLKWDDEKYTFYINGVETRSTSFGFGTSPAFEDVIVSMEIPDEDILFPTDYETQFIVDYVKIYQLAE